MTSAKATELRGSFTHFHSQADELFGHWPQHGIMTNRHSGWYFAPAAIMLPVDCTTMHFLVYLPRHNLTLVVLAYCITKDTRDHPYHAR